MKAVLHNRVVHVGVIATLAVLVAAAYFIKSPSTTAAVSNTVGTISIELGPTPSSVGTEYIILRYGGIGKIDFSGWRIKNESSLEYVLDKVVLEDGQQIKICADSTKDAGCADEWNGGDAWNDASGRVVILNQQNEVVLDGPYSGSGVGTLINLSGSVNQQVFTQKDSLTVCHSTNGVDYSGPNGSIKNIISEKGGHGQHEFDIIPAFFYNLGKGPGYYAGKNWPDASGVYARGCRK